MQLLKFHHQQQTLTRFLEAKRWEGDIFSAVASRSTFIGSGEKIVPSLSVALSTKNASRISVTSPVGTSAGRHEPASFTPKGKFQAIEKAIFDKYIKNQLIDKFCNPIEIDNLLEKINAELPARKDGIDTPFSRLGGPNATATSIAAVLALAASAGVVPEVAIYHLYNQIAAANNLPQIDRITLPVFMSKIVDGGMHGNVNAKGLPSIPVQEFLFIPLGYTKYTDALEATEEATERFWEIMRRNNFEALIGAEGGIKSRHLISTPQVLNYMSRAIAGFDGKSPLPGIFIGLDVAASELYDEKQNKYYLGRDGQKLFASEYVDYPKLTRYYQQLIKDFPAIISIEDPYAEDHAEAWKSAFPQLKNEVMVITDDATVTQPDRVNMAIDNGWGNGLLTKINQGGTFSNTCLAIALAKQVDWQITLSHRSMEAADFIFEALLAIGTGAEFLKVTVGSVKGGGGGREGRPNAISMANVYWEDIYKEAPAKDSASFWQGVPKKHRLAGLPYQGAIILNRPADTHWLKHVQSLVKARYTGKPAAYRFSQDSWD